MKSTDDSLRLENLVELDDVYWGGKKNGKLSLGISGKTSFSEAVSHNDKGHLLHMRMNKVKAFTSFAPNNKFFY